jgi:nuclear cap-binding protein subunit 1
MSDYNRHHGRGGGGRRRNYQRDDYEDRRREETPDQKTKNLIIRLGEVDATEEVPRVASQLLQPAHGVPAIAEGFRIAVTEQPFKIPYYAALLHHLYSEGTEGHSPIGPSVLEDIWRGFQSCLDRLAWREIRYFIQFFAHLTEAGIVSSDSMVSLLLSLIAVIDEFGASYGRAKRAALSAVEGLMIAGYTLKQAAPEKVAAMIESILGYNEGVVAPKWVVQPDAHFSLDKQPSTYSFELLNCAVSALKALDTEDFTSHSFLRPYADYPSLSGPSFVRFDLPSVLVPPEIIEVEGLSATTGEELQVKKEEWPEHFLKLFDASITPNPQSPTGYTVKSALMDIVTIFEVNRKECARLLLEYPKWTVSGTFKPKPGSQTNAEEAQGNNWELESTVIEVR